VRWWCCSTFSVFRLVTFAGLTWLYKIDGLHEGVGEVLGGTEPVYLPVVSIRKVYFNNVFFALGNQFSHVGTQSTSYLAPDRSVFLPHRAYTCSSRTIVRQAFVGGLGCPDQWTLNLAGSASVTMDTSLRAYHEKKHYDPHCPHARKKSKASFKTLICLCRCLFSITHAIYNSRTKIP
jgi:hypothetical protein